MDPVSAATGNDTGTGELVHQRPAGLTNHPRTATWGVFDSWRAEPTARPAGLDLGGGMLERVISGGQTGADQAGLAAAKACGIPTGGWMPKGFLTVAAPTRAWRGSMGSRSTAGATRSGRGR
ncbi:MAG TPA: putative molybdenum carrier protein, partial [Gemmataceae bacterium]|nr:putative molybdenum carrier protein [Gemmataceae bacterium]